VPAKENLDRIYASAKTNYITKSEKKTTKNISPCKEEVKCEMSAIQPGWREFEETITDALDRQSKGVMEIVQQQAQNHREFSSEL
jgi:rubrerythrin